MKDPVGVFIMRWRTRVVLDVLQGDVLDVGCGTNELMHAYKVRHPERIAIGIDVHPWKGVDTVIESSARLPFDDDSFDTVCCIAALNCIPEREGFLLEAQRVLRPHGRLVLTMLSPGISRIWRAIRDPWAADQQELRMDEGQAYGFTAAQMRDILEAARFTTVETKRFMLGINRLYLATVKT